jgi:hypothetical protein
MSSDDIGPEWLKPLFFYDMGGILLAIDFFQTKSKAWSESIGLLSRQLQCHAFESTSILAARVASGNIIART